MLGFSDTDEAADKRKASIGSICAGLLYGASWWILIAGFANGEKIGDEVSRRAAGYAWLPLFGTTVSFIMINGMNWMELKEDSMLAGASPKVAARARLFLIGALFIALICLGMSLYIMSEVFLADESAYAFAGVSVFIGTLLQIVATWIMRATTIPSDA